MSVHLVFLVRRLAASLVLSVVSALTVHAAPADASLTPQQAARDAEVLVTALRTLHPALDKYRSSADVEAAFARFGQQAGAARTPQAMYLAATELAAAIRCGHTWTNVLNQQGPIKAHLLERADKLPFTLALVAQRWLVLASATPGVQAGDEIVTIDGYTSGAIVARMLPYLRADGSSDGKRLRQLSHDRGDYSMMDIVWPLLAPPAGGVYQLRVRGANGAVRSVAAPATTLAARSASLPARSAALPSAGWQLAIDGQRAVMTLPTFALYRSNFDWRAFFATSFAELAQRQVRELVIDIRANEGGDGAIGLELLSYLVREPVRASADQSVTMYERIPAALTPYLDTWDKGFYDRSGQVDPIVDGPQAGRLRFRPYANKVTMITPRATRFTGKALLLVGPENSSATFSLAQLVKQTGAATLVGQPTGGNLRGLNGGQLAWVTLPHSGVAVDIPLLATSYRADTPDAGIAPDLLVERHFDRQAAGIDEEMAAALALPAR